MSCAKLKIRLENCPEPLTKQQNESMSWKCSSDLSNLSLTAKCPASLSLLNFQGKHFPPLNSDLFGSNFVAVQISPRAVCSRQN